MDVAKEREACRDYAGLSESQDVSIDLENCTKDERDVVVDEGDKLEDSLVGEKEQDKEVEKEMLDGETTKTTKALTQNFRDKGIRVAETSKNKKKKSGRTAQEEDDLDKILAELGEWPTLSKPADPPPSQEVKVENPPDLVTPSDASVEKEAEEESTETTVARKKKRRTTKGKRKREAAKEQTRRQAVNRYCVNTDVAMTITKRLLQSEGKNSNVFLPLSIHVLLSLIAAGSNGPTLDQLLSFLKYNSIAQLNHFTFQIASMVLADDSLSALSLLVPRAPALDQLLSFLKSNSVDNLNAFASHIIDKVFADASSCGGPRLAFANGVWIDQSLSLKPSFQQAEKVISSVNSWVERNTYGLIKEILPPRSVDSFTRLILANALYFKGAWEKKFDASKIVKRDFYLVDGSSVEAPFMTDKEDQYVAVFDGFKVLALPYSQGSDPRRFSMYFFLPDSKDGLASLIEKLDSEPGFIDRHIPRRKHELGKFMIPKFKISFGIEVSDVLKKLGLVLPFTEGGLLEMVEPPMARNLSVSKIFHKAFIEVNEEGTEAAASSAAVIQFMSAPIGLIEFVANHPFLYLIREDKSGTLLFIGQVLNPLED
ncbi:Serpin-ZX, partial [Cucurbita argyrosperma subsp. sororia]